MGHEAWGMGHGAELAEDAPFGEGALTLHRATKLLSRVLGLWRSVCLVLLRVWCCCVFGVAACLVLLRVWCGFSGDGQVWPYSIDAARAHVMLGGQSSVSSLVPVWDVLRSDILLSDGTERKDGGGRDRDGTEMGRRERTGGRQGGRDGGCGRLTVSFRLGEKLCGGGRGRWRKKLKWGSLRKEDAVARGQRQARRGCNFRSTACLPPCPPARPPARLPACLPACLPAACLPACPPARAPACMLPACLPASCLLEADFPAEALPPSVPPYTIATQTAHGPACEENGFAPRQHAHNTNPTPSTRRHPRPPQPRVVVPPRPCPGSWTSCATP
eukprot:358115-Chlamydomonas_euryale.AAC.2